MVSVSMPLKHKGLVEPAAGRLSLWALFAYALPAFQTALLQGPAASIVPTLYATEFGLSLTLVGTAVFVSRALDALIDPTVGYLSDHTRTRLGRRKPWVIAGAGLTMITTLFLFIPPPHPSFLYFLAWYAGLYFAWSLMEIPHAAWGYEITRDYNDRSRLFALRIFVMAAGQMVFLLAPLLPIFKTTAVTPATIRFIAYGVLFIVPITAAVATMWGPVGAPAETSNEFRLKDLLSIVRGNKPLWLFLGAFVPSTFALGMFGATSFLYFTDYLGVANQFIYIFMVLTGCQILFLPAAAPIMNRLGKHQTWAMAISFGLVVMLFMLFVPRGPKAIIPLILLAIPIAFSNALTQVAPYSMYGDVIDYDTLKTGKKRAATYSALYTLLLKLNIAAGAAVAFIIVGLVGYHPKSVNTPNAVLGLKIAFVLAPTLINGLAIFFIWKFPLTRDRQAVVRRRLERLDCRRQLAHNPPRTETI